MYNEKNMLEGAILNCFTLSSLTNAVLLYTYLLLMFFALLYVTYLV